MVVIQFQITDALHFPLILLCVGVLSVCCGRSGVRFLPADVFLHHCAVYWHPPHGGENHPHREHSRKYNLQFHEKYMNHSLLHLSTLSGMFSLIVSSFPTLMSLHKQLADLNRRLPAEAGMPPSKPGPLRPRETPPPPRPSPHTITLQAPAFRNLRLPKRLRVVYFLARTRLAQRIIMVKITPFKGIVHPKN